MVASRGKGRNWGYFVFSSWWKESGRKRTKGCRVPWERKKRICSATVSRGREVTVAWPSLWSRDTSWNRREVWGATMPNVYWDSEVTWRDTGLQQNWSIKPQNRDGHQELIWSPAELLGKHRQLLSKFNSSWNSVCGSHCQCCVLKTN